VRTIRKIFFIFAITALVVANVRLAMALVRSVGEHECLLRRLDALIEKNKEIDGQFVLKQDHMRKILTDRDFIERVIRQREGYIKRTETVFRFED
jgi:hypothetical protein